MCIYVYIGLCMSARVHGGKRVLTPSELELQAVASHLVWMLGTELRSSASSMYSYQLSHLSSS